MEYCRKKNCFQPRGEIMFAPMERLIVQPKNSKVTEFGYMYIYFATFVNVHILKI